MATLAGLEANEDAVVLKVNADGELKRRLFSLGLRKSSHVRVKAVSLNKSTMEIETGACMLALRFEEAKKIEVEKI
jgi:ferrous iron transport protein A